MAKTGFAHTTLHHDALAFLEGADGKKAFKNRMKAFVIAS